MKGQKILFVQASYPRSGTTWTSLLLKHHYGIGMRSIYDRGLPKKSKQHYAEQLGSHSQLLGMKTHKLERPPRCKGLPVLLVTRDGRDALVSYAHYHIDYMKIRKGCSHLQILHSLVGNQHWSVLHRFWLDRGAILLRYEDLKQSPFSALKAAMDRVLPGFEPVTEDPMPLTFDETHQKVPKFFRRGIIGSWRDEMRPGTHELFWSTHHEMMSVLGYER